MTPLDRMVLRAYDLIWHLSLPLLKCNSRIREGFDERIKGPSGLKKSVDLWIQAASAGEAYLALALLEKLSAIHKLRILVTTNTRQGFDILNTAFAEQDYDSRNFFIAYFPFDSPGNMANIVKRLQPRITILLETEIWPGLLAALKKTNRPAIILNGRLSPASLKHYLLYPRIFRAVAPERILAISSADAERFSHLFQATMVDTMPNIKFDRISFPTHQDQQQNPLAPLFGATPDLVVLGSIREEEEAWVEKIISGILTRMPHLRIALFPRHMHRLNNWQAILNQNAWPWHLRSAMKTTVLPGTIILWDTFGELSTAYALATTVFVGGSLANLGGQNFLEPLAYGVRPIIGPHWDNFFWIGEEIFAQKLVLRCQDWQAVATALINSIVSPADPEKIKARAQDYIQHRQGGVLQSYTLIKNMLLRQKDRSNAAQ